jgi:hypothetical protein
MPEIKQFNTGAVRSGDADNEDYWLISPIGLKRVAKFYSSLNEYSMGPDSKGYLNLALHDTYIYLSGARNVDYLARAAMFIFESITIIETGSSTEYYKSNCDYRFDLIPQVAIQRLAETYHEGSVKYGPYNWEKGMPVHDLLNHGIRHIYLYLAGDESEPQLPHASWAYIAAMHSEEMWPELNKGVLRGPNCSIPGNK